MEKLCTLVQDSLPLPALGRAGSSLLLRSSWALAPPLPWYFLPTVEPQQGSYNTQLATKWMHARQASKHGGLAGRCGKPCRQGPPKSTHTAWSCLLAGGSTFSIQHFQLAAQRAWSLKANQRPTVCMT